MYTYSFRKSIPVNVSDNGNVGDFLNKSGTRFNGLASIIQKGLSCFILLLCIATKLSAVSVTFKVDMSQQVISPDGVHLAGSFQGWDPSTTLMTDIGGGIFCVVLDLPPGTYQFKFINGNSWGTDESVPPACGVDDGSGIFNRQIIVSSGPLVMPELCFASCSICPPPGYVTNGNASYLGGDCYQVTPNAPWQNSTMWNNTQIDLTQDFSMQFTLNLGPDDGGADGLVFVLQRIGTTAIGASGGGMGYSSFGTSVGIEFDTFYNPEYNDPVFDHVAIEVNGDVDHLSSNQLAGPVQMSPFSANTEDGTDHVVQIVWDATSFSLSVYFDCQLIISATNDLITNIFSGQNLVYWGFTGATGAYYNPQTFCIQPNALVTQDISICPGSSAQLNAGASSTSVYNWTPATDLNDPSVADPLATPASTTTYTVQTTDLCGAVTTRVVNVIVMENNPACALLPVSLISFDVQAVDNNIQFQWRTLSEWQNSHFTIEETFDNITFHEKVVEPGSGNSGFPLSYYAFATRSGRDAYYRLRQTDWNGISEVISNLEFVPALISSRVMINYNPVSKVLKLNVTNGESIGSIEVIASSGKLVAIERAVDSDSSTYDFHIDLKAGLYVVLWRDAMGALSGSGKFVVLN